MSRLHLVNPVPWISDGDALIEIFPCAKCSQKLEEWSYVAQAERQFTMASSSTSSLALSLFPLSLFPLSLSLSLSADSDLLSLSFPPSLSSLLSLFLLSSFLSPLLGNSTVVSFCLSRLRSNIAKR